MKLFTVVNHQNQCYSENDISHDLIYYVPS